MLYSVHRWAMCLPYSVFYFSALIIVFRLWGVAGMAADVVAQAHEGLVGKMKEVNMV